MVSAHPVRPAYVTAGVVLVGLGVLAIFTIGLPVLVAGLILLVDGFTNAHRRWPRVFWPIVVGIAVLFVGYVLVAPLSCTSEAVARESGHAVGATSCTNLVGIDYSGGPGYNPPLWPALLAGVAGGAIAGAVTRLSLADGGR